MYFDILKVTYLTDYRIELVFENGKSGVVDLKEYVNDKDVFKAFNDIEYFKRFKIDYGALVWGDDELDIAPETLYLKATKEKEIKWGNNPRLNKVS